MRVHVAVVQTTCQRASRRYTTMPAQSTAHIRNGCECSSVSRSQIVRRREHPCAFVTIRTQSVLAAGVLPGQEIDEFLRVKDNLSRFLTLGHEQCGWRLNVEGGLFNDCIEGTELVLTGDVHGVFRKVPKEDAPDQFWNHQQLLNLVESWQ